MIITRIALSTLAPHDLSSPSVALLLASHQVNDVAVLVWCNWSRLEDCWENSIDLKKLARHYRFNAHEVQFLPATLLSASDLDIDASANLNIKNGSEQQLLVSAITQLQQYFQGGRHHFDLPLDISSGTLFQQQVWQALLKIKHGEAISYATLAQRVGNPKAYRAVANANGKNPISIIIPCHRVISSDGRLGGYTGGTDKKAYLLAIENISYEK